MNLKVNPTRTENFEERAEEVIRRDSCTLKSVLLMHSKTSAGVLDYTGDRQGQSVWSVDKDHLITDLIPTLQIIALLKASWTQ